MTDFKDFEQFYSYISTHTLTWSVTSSSVGGSSVSVISTHTLTWSVTIAVLQLVLITKISTHTLTWSVTTRFTALALYYTNFNSHAHVERDNIGVTTSQQMIEFQLTRSRGA